MKSPIESLMKSPVGSPTKSVEEILNFGTQSEQRALFSFDKDTDFDLVIKKFQVWGRWFFPRFFSKKDAIFHAEIDKGNLKVYTGLEHEFLDIAFRGAAKTLRTKVFIAFCIANDLDHYRKYFKVLSKDGGNSKQSVTDVYNMLVSKRVKYLYPEVFTKTDSKREETMSSFTTATGIKMTADTIGTDQRGDIQDESRPDFIWFDDFETKLSLISAVLTHKIWANIDEAIQGLSKDGGVVYTCNYISERGNVHKLVEKIDHKIIIPIEKDGIPTWDIYSTDDLKRLKKNADDYAGEYLCKPEISQDVYFKRESVDRQIAIEPIDEIAGFKIFKEYDPSHRIVSGHDVAGGVGLDSSTSVFLDLDMYPIQVIATYKNNMIKPDVFAHEIIRQCKLFGQNYCAVEKNYGSTLDILKTLYLEDKIHKTYTAKPRIVFQRATEYGWDTNSATKETMLAEMQKALKDGIIQLNDNDLIAEVRSYTRNDLLDPMVDPRLTTRHFDLLMALCIAYAVRGFVDKPEKESNAYDPLEEFLQKQNSNNNPAR